VNCEQANEVLMLDLYGEAAAADVVELRAHLAGCAACRRAAEASREALAEFRREPALRPARETIESVLAAAQPRPRFAGLFVLARPAVWQATAVVMIALAASVAIQYWPHTTAPTAGESAAVTAQAAATETSWDTESAQLSEHIRLAQADVTLGSSLDNRITGLRDALTELRKGSDGF
jgi:predicted anti-sigma-YlaC factor YlaD